MSLAGQHILITRAANQAGSLQDQLERLGARVTAIATIRIAPPDDWSAFDVAARIAGAMDWMIFTSANGAYKAKERLDELELTLPKTLKIAVVGNQTAKAVSACGWNNDLQPTGSFQQEGLLKALKQQGLEGKRIWFPRAKEARPFLKDSLAEAGAKVFLSYVYQNAIPWENQKAIQNTIAQGGIDWVTFTSSSTATHFFTLLGEQPATMPKIASIGSSTTATLAQFALTPVFTAEPQNIEGLVQGLTKNAELE